MKSFADLFQERANRILALSIISQIALEGLSQLSKDSSTPFAAMFQSMASNIPAHHQNNSSINIPEYRVIGFLDGLTLIATISEIEAYLQDLVTIVLIRHPEKIGNTSFDLKTLLESGSVEVVKQLAAERFAAEMLFKKPAEYKKSLMSVLSIGDVAFGADWSVFVEAKARRDIGVHNNWAVNEIYRNKVREAGLSPAVSATLTVDHPYLNTVRSSCLALMNRLRLHCQGAFV